jgi:hypothetical protein
MSLQLCPLQCGKYISTFQSHKEECKNKSRLGKYCQQCPYNPEHVLSIKALKVHVHYCQNRPKSTIFRINKSKNDSIPLKKGIPPLDIVRPKKILPLPSYKNLIPISLSEGSLKETSKVYNRNKEMYNLNYQRIKKQEKKLLMYYIDNKEEEKVPCNKEKYICSTKDINYPKFSYEHNMFLKKNHKYEIIRKSNSRIFDDKAKISTADEDSLNTKKNFYW